MYIHKQFPNGKTGSKLSTSSSRKNSLIQTYNMILYKLSIKLNKLISTYNEDCNKPGLRRRRRDETSAYDQSTIKQKETENLLQTYHHARAVRKR